MKVEKSVRLLDVWVGARDPRQAKKVEHDLVELLVVAVCTVLSGADTFVARSRRKRQWSGYGNT